MDQAITNATESAQKLMKEKDDIEAELDALTKTLESVKNTKLFMNLMLFHIH